MGTLVVFTYPTKLFLKAADHTYVECGTGAKGWNCWGGKSGGKKLRCAPGSTLRADTVAGKNERSGITCYLINGVCHQAANRILDQSQITVDGARGYSLSVSIFGVLGRRNGFLGTCKAPFYSHPGVTGDLQDCIESRPRPRAQVVNQLAVPVHSQGYDFEDRLYMEAVRALHDRAEAEVVTDPASLLKEQMQHFKLMVRHKLGLPEHRIAPSAYSQLMAVREQFEWKRLMAEKELADTSNPLAFVEVFDRLTLQFQDDVARTLDEKSYSTLLNLSPDERVVLSDPDIVEQIYGSRPDPAGAKS